MNRTIKLQFGFRGKLCADNLGKTFKLFSILLLVLLGACSDESAIEQTDGPTVSSPHSTSEKSRLDNLQGSLEKNSDPEQQSELFADTMPDLGDQVDAEAIDEEVADSEDDEYAYYEPSTTVTFSAEETSGVIRWKAPEGVDYSNAKVIISGKGGDMTTRNFSPGEPIELFGELPDGVYSWETVITPEIDDSVKEQMRSVRNSGNLREEKQLMAQLRAEGSLPTQEQVEANRQSGSFIVRGGIVRPSLVDDPNSDSD